MSHRLMDEAGELEAQLAEVNAAISAAARADVVDLKLIADARRRRQELRSWLEKAREALAR